MDTIELNIWEPVEDKPGYVHIVDQPTAQEVFAELKQRLESIGYLPNEYFLLNGQWENGTKIPVDADIFCTADYGSSEGIYLDVYLNWYDQDKRHTESFITGKTLDDTPDALDRMHLVASAVMKAFHGDGSVHARYIRLGENTSPTGTVFHLNPDEHRLLVDSLVARRNSLKEDFSATEQLLRRATGSITEFVNEVGERPLKISDFDRTVLAIEDGNLPEFLDHYRKTENKVGDLLAYAAGRPGNIGNKMTALMLSIETDIPYDQYLTACKRAVDSGNVERTLLLCEQADNHISALTFKPELYGEIIYHACNDKRHIAKALVEQCSPEQIAVAKPYLLVAALYQSDYKLAGELVSKGIDTNTHASDVFRALSGKNDTWVIDDLFRKGMNVDPQNYQALDTAIDLSLTDVAKRLLDSGMDFDKYSEWANAFSNSVNNETFGAVEEYWAAIQDRPEAALEQNNGQTMAEL